MASYLELEVKAPPPLNQFRGDGQMSAHNRAVEDAARYDKIMSNAQLRQARKRLAHLQSQLDEHHVDALLAELNKLIAEHDSNRTATLK